MGHDWGTSSFSSGASWEPDAGDDDMRMQMLRRRRQAEEEAAAAATAAAAESTARPGRDTRLPQSSPPPPPPPPGLRSLRDDPALDDLPWPGQAHKGSPAWMLEADEPDAPDAPEVLTLLPAPVPKPPSSPLSDYQQEWNELLPRKRNPWQTMDAQELQMLLEEQGPQGQPSEAARLLRGELERVEKTRPARTLSGDVLQPASPPMDKLFVRPKSVDEGLTGRPVPIPMPVLEADSSAAKQTKAWMPDGKPEPRIRQPLGPVHAATDAAPGSHPDASPLHSTLEGRNDMKPPAIRTMEGRKDMQLPEFKTMEGKTGMVPPFVEAVSEQKPGDEKWVADVQHPSKPYVGRRYDMPAAAEEALVPMSTVEPVPDAEVERDKITRAALEGVLAGKEPLEALKEWQSATPGIMAQGPQDYLTAYKHITRVLDPHYKTMQNFMDATERRMDGRALASDEPLLKAGAEWLLDMKDEERPLILAALRADAEKRGLVNAEKKGQGYLRGAGQTVAGLGQAASLGALGRNPEADLFWQQVGESVFRFGKAAMTNRDGHERRITRVPETGSVRFNGQAIRTPEDARKYVEDRLLEEISDEGHMQLTGYPKSALSYFFDKRNEVTLDPAATRLIQEAKARKMKEVGIGAEIENLGNITDPIPNVFASTLGTSGAALGVTVATRGMALPLLIAGYKNIEFNDLSLNYPKMSHGDRAQIAWLSGSIQGAADVFGAKLLSKIPSVKSLLTGQLTRRVIASALARTAAGYVGENGLEAVQDIATPALMAAMKSDVPGYDWDRELEVFWQGRADVAVGMLPLTLLGLGRANAQEMHGVQEMLSQEGQMASAGIPEAERKTIMELAQRGDIQAAAAELQEAWDKRDPKAAAEHYKTMDVQGACRPGLFGSHAPWPNAAGDANGGRTVHREGSIGHRDDV